MNHTTMSRLEDHPIPNTKELNCSAISILDNKNTPVHGSEDVKPYGPLTQSETENLQMEANEDTTRSEDLRLFLQEMREKIKEEQEQLQQQLQQAQAAGTVAYIQTSNRQALELPESAAALHRQRMARMIRVHRGSVAELNDPAPDGGWSWVVLFCSFCCLILVDGIALSYGLLISPQCGYSDMRFTVPITTNTSPQSPPRERLLRPVVGSCVPMSDLGDEMGTQRRLLLLIPGAVLLGTYLFLGPLVSAMTNQFDFRPVTMIGAIFSTIGLFSSSLAPNLEVLSITYGVLGGIGLSLIYLPAIATVGQWFQKRRPLAVGLALCGSGVGWFVGAQGVRRLVAWFTWRGALIIMAAACFQSLFLISMFRPLDHHYRICEAQQSKRAVREAARRKSALHRLEIERRLSEIRQRRRFADCRNASDAPLAYRGLQPHRNLQEAKQGTHRGAGHRARVGAVVTRSNRAGRGAILGPSLLHNRGDIGRGNVLAGRPYRGSIMQRIIEEKHRQRTTSVGSLDGMVITRDNKLIAAPVLAGPDRPVLSLKTIRRLSETIVKKYESKLQQAVLTDGTAGSHTAVSRNLHANFPAVVTEYIQSQISMLQQPGQSMVLPQVSGLAAVVSPDPYPVEAPDRDPLADPVNLSAGPSSGGAVSGHSTPADVQPIDAAVSCGLGQQQDALSDQNSASNNAYECVSVRPHSSEMSLQSVQPIHNGANVTAATDVSGAVSLTDAAEVLLTDEIRADIHHRLRKELARPQYKKDLFYTGSVRQLNSNRSGADTASAGWHIGEKCHSFIAPGLMFSPNTSLRMPGTRSSVLGISQANEPAAAFHTSQTNLSLALSTGAGVGTSFVPPAPCPLVSHQLNTSPQVLSTSLQVPGGEAGDSSSAQQNGTETPKHPPSTEIVPLPQTPLTVNVHCNQEGDNAEVFKEPEFDGHLELDLEDGLMGGFDAPNVADEVSNNSDTDEGVCSQLSRWLRRCCSSYKGRFHPLTFFLLELLDPRLLAKHTFQFMFLSSTITTMGFFIPFLMLPDLLAEASWTLSDSGFALSAIGVSNTIGRLVMSMYIEKGWSATYRWTDCLWLNNGTLLVSGITVALMPIVRVHYSGFISICLIHGFCCAVFVSLKSILVVELTDIDRLTNAFGHMLLLQGLAAVSGLVVAGYLHDMQLNLVAPDAFVSPDVAPVHHASSIGFYFSGACLACGCLFGLPLRFFASREFQQKTESASTKRLRHPDSNIDPTGRCSNPLDGQFMATSEPFATNLYADPSNPHFVANTKILDQAGVALPTSPPIANQAASSTHQGIAASTPSDGAGLGVPCVTLSVNEVTDGTSANDQIGGQTSLPVTCPDDHSVFDSVPTPFLVIPSSGVAVPLVPATPVTMTSQIKKTEVIGLQEEPGLEPVAEEEEEEEDVEDTEASLTAPESTIPPTHIKRFEVVTVAESSLQSTEEPTNNSQKQKKRRKPTKDASGPSNFTQVEAGDNPALGGQHQVD